MKQQDAKIFVGTLYSGEGEFQCCIDKIHKQKNVEITHCVIAGLGEKDAHNSLWAAWKNARESHDLFVKIDADTVLCSDNTLFQVWQQFLANPRVTGLQAPLDDYMTKTLINGLNAFSPKVVFNDTRDDLYCDRQVDVGHDIVLRSNEIPISLRPAGLHCYHSSDKQAFHYGLHRTLKNQRHTIDLVKSAWMNDRDRARAMALIGSAMSHQFVNNHKFNYCDEEFKEALLKAETRYDEFSKYLASGRLDRIR